MYQVKSIPHDIMMRTWLNSVPVVYKYLGLFQYFLATVVDDTLSPASSICVKLTCHSFAAFFCLSKIFCHVVDDDVTSHQVGQQLLFGRVLQKKKMYTLGKLQSKIIREELDKFA